MVHIGWLKLTHILDGVLHGDIVLALGHSADEALGQYVVLETVMVAPPVALSLRLTRTPGLFGPLTSLEDVPVAYPREFPNQSWELRAQDLQDILDHAKRGAERGFMLPVYNLGV